MNNFIVIKEFLTKSGKYELYGPETNSKDFKGLILFVHGFNSNHMIWGNVNTGFIHHALDHEYLPFAINFSDPIKGSIVEMANNELDMVINFLLEKFKMSLHIVAHSMGGIVTRYYLFCKFKSRYDFNIKLKIKSVALLGVPNHGIFNPLIKETGPRIVKLIEKIVQEINKVEKLNIKLLDKAYFQLLSGNSIITQLNDAIEYSLHKSIYWMNFYGSKDFIVTKKSAIFESSEIPHLRANFFQKEFNTTHMKNPLAFFSDLIPNTLEKKRVEVKENLEKKLQSMQYVTNDPIYDHLPLMEKYFELMTLQEKNKIN